MEEFALAPRRAHVWAVAALATAACHPSAGPAAAESEASTTEVATSPEGDVATRLDMGVALPDGCGDGVATPGQYCYTPTAIEGIEHMTAAFGIDFDADGRDELVVGGDLSGELLQLAYEDGRLVELARIETVLLGHPTTAFDANGDGRRDLLLIWGSGASGTSLRWFRNEGRVLGPAMEDEFPLSLWTDPDQLSSGGISGAVDLDGDAFPEFVADMYLTGWGLPINRAQIVRRGPEGWTLDAPPLEGWVLPGCGYFAEQGLADLDADGRLELVLLDYAENCDPILEDYDPAYHRFLVFGTDPETGAFELLRSVPVGERQTIATRQRNLWVRDVDGDGHVDVVVRTSRMNGPDDYTRGYAVHRGRGDGRFRVPLLLQGSIDLAELDGDPELEVVIHEDDGLYAARAVAPDLERVQLHAAIPNAQGVSVQGVADVNGDGLEDLAVVENRPDEPYRPLLLVSRP